MNELGGDGRTISFKTASEIMQRHEEDLNERMQHAKRCRGWYDDQHAEWMDGLNTKRKQRFEEIIKRLRDVGWEKEIDFLVAENSLDDMASLPVVQQSSKLTPKTWEKVLAAVKEFLERTRKDRLAKERGEVLRPRFLDLEQAILSYCVQLPRVPRMDCRPGYVDLAMMDECKAIADAPGSQTVTREDFAAIMPDLASLWEEKRKQELGEAIRKCFGSLGEEVEPLALAIAVFPCTLCSRGTQPLAFYHYPDVLAHPCGRMHGDMRMFFEGGGVEWDQAVYNNAVCRTFANDPYSKCRFPFALKNMCRSDAILQRTLKNMRGIVEALGLDPARAAVDELRMCEGRVRCVQCSTSQTATEDHQDMVYTWDAALVHAWSKKSLIEHDQWESVGSNDMQTIKKLEEKEHVRFPSLWSPGSVWACSLCVDWDGEGHDVVSHLLTEHNITTAAKCTSDGTLYLHPGKSVAVIRPPIVFPY
ncbi:hypothetical protein OH76DRAFT_1481957 [Lentinus brumalis]|uniref:Uncharacterized protein n=1 Tax=Lentinus brumalis TaxID=2498619 RepID=A0A371DEF4_9APHY|nr:hypothetical protein OH76DRAFT_1481957 [Polyporus brumalis]